MKKGSPSSLSRNNEHSDETFCGDASTSDMSTISIGSQEGGEGTTNVEEKMFGTVILSPGGYRRKKRIPRNVRGMMPEDTLDGDSLHLTRCRVPVRNGEEEGEEEEGDDDVQSNNINNNCCSTTTNATTVGGHTSTAKVVAEYDTPLK